MKSIFTFLLLLICIFGYSQNEIKGKVVNSVGEDMISATVVLLEEQDSTMVTFCLTNSKGEFVLDDVPAGVFILQVSYISYANLFKNVTIENESYELDLGEIVIEESTEVLNEITISADHIPMGVRGDTISYNASAFKTRPYASVEDLLKRLPGIEVERNGNIKAQGEDVENVLVDGKEFFGGDPKMTTKNLAADAVDKVEVYDKKSEVAEFTGVDDGEEEKTINLQLKEDRKNDGFGTIDLEAGNEDNYNTKVNYFRFNPQMQASVIFSANNINEETFSFEDRMEFMGGIANVMSAGGLGMSSNPFSSQGLNESLSAGLNFNYDFSSKLEWRSHYLRNRNSNDLIQNSLASSFSDDFTYETADSLLSDRTINDHQVNTKVTYKLSPFTELSSRNNLYWNDSDFSSGNTVNYSRDGLDEGYSFSDLSTAEKNLEYESRTLWKQKFDKKGRNLISSALFKSSDRESMDSILNLNRVVNNIFDIHQNQFYGSKLKQMSLSSKYTEPLSSKLFLGVEYQYSYNHEKPYRSYFDIVNEQEIRNEDLSSNYDKRYNYHVAGLSLKRNTKRLKNSIGLSMQRTSLQGKVNTEEILIDSSYTHLLPSMSTELRLKGGKTMSFNYFTSVITPDLEQLLPFPDNRSANFQFIGNPALGPEYRHNLGFNYHAFDNFNFSSFWANISFSYTKNKIVNRTTIDEFFFRTIEAINTDKQKTLSMYMNYSRPFKPLKIKYSIRARYRYSSYNSFVNSLATEVGEDNANIKLSVSNRKTDKVFVEAGFAVDRTTRNYGLDNSFDQSFFNTNAYLDLELYFSNGWTVGSTFNRRSYSSESFSDSPNFSLWNVSLRKLLFNNALELRLSAFDILSQNLSYYRSGGANYIQETYYNQLQSYYSIGLKYNLGKVRRGGLQMEVN